jgi:two-component system response regulator (stage 0 sporulation protein F)
MALGGNASCDEGRSEMMKRPASEGAVDERPRSVLLAEDDDDLRQLLADAFRAEGFSVIECSDGLALVETLVWRLEAGERPFNLIVSDVRMPGVTGLSVLEGLSGWDGLQNPPVILITAFGDPRLRELARQFGAVSLLEKPFEIKALMRIVREAIDRCDSGASRSVAGPGGFTRERSGANGAL